MALRAEHLPEFADTKHHRQLFLGKAGERYVASRLLRLGYSAAEAPVDTGVDILAHRVVKGGDSLVYQVQVKSTTSLDWTQTFSVDRYERLYRQVINLVVVFWRTAGNPTAVVLPPSMLYFLSEAGGRAKDTLVYLSRNGRKRSLRLVLRPGPVLYVRRREFVITPMIDQFQLLEDTTLEAAHVPPYVGIGGSGTTIAFYDDASRQVR